MLCGRQTQLRHRQQHRSSSSSAPSGFVFCVRQSWSVLHHRPGVVVASRLQQLLCAPRCRNRLFIVIPAGTTPSIHGRWCTSASMTPRRVHHVHDAFIPRSSPVDAHSTGRSSACPRRPNIAPRKRNSAVQSGISDSISRNHPDASYIAQA